MRWKGARTKSTSSPRSDLFVWACACVVLCANAEHNVLEGQISWACEIALGKQGGKLVEVLCWSVRVWFARLRGLRRQSSGRDRSGKDECGREGREEHLGW